jgi:hypothetical protein
LTVQKDLLKLKKMLVNRRREILEQVAHLEAEDEELRQRFIEPDDKSLLNIEEV